MEATTFAVSISINYLGKIVADLIDYHLTLYYKITHYNFGNLSRLVFVENLLHLIPLIYLLAIPRKFFSANKNKSQAKELSTIDEEQNNNIKEEENNDDNNNEILVQDIIENYANDEYIDEDLNINKREQNSYRYLFF